MHRHRKLRGCKTPGIYRFGSHDETFRRREGPLIRNDPWIVNAAFDRIFRY
jgi:hypothetical protein